VVWEWRHWASAASGTLEPTAVPGAEGWPAAVSVLQGLMKEAVLVFKKVRPEAMCKTCCLEGIIRPNLVRKSMLIKGMATAANKKPNLKFVKRQRRRISKIPNPRWFCRCPLPCADLWVALWKCGGGGAGSHRQPTCFPGMCSLSSTSGAAALKRVW
jgi:hypothetical protein